jgi:hypothetical protein
MRRSESVELVSRVSWRRGDERLITVDGVCEPDGWYFVIAGTFDTVRG